ncbi:hypothetical protein FKM82_014802 [Ascaphus truei]
MFNHIQYGKQLIAFCPTDFYINKNFTSDTMISRYDLSRKVYILSIQYRSSKFQCYKCFKSNFITNNKVKMLLIVALGQPNYNQNVKTEHLLFIGAFFVQTFLKIIMVHSITVLGI